ncbi:TonB-dependent receptor [Glacieibacterium frigidum]|uniref:TonB-dependent receptor n=1 Tax=Glacieibacterium frigidum TaxID=2593303 RepID=A0A552U9X5_9SPHN|nr:TonB-dependent receptor [Glacieibacterium frigidum]TRW15023.1 TonB-dependent receptor [Glacieibacterium frigidum]
MRHASLLRCTVSFAVIAAATPLWAQTAAPAPAAPAVPAPAAPAAAADEAPAPAAATPATPGATAAADEGEAEEIIVTGIRESLASSQNLKRRSVQVVDAVVAEDIGKLPDLAVSDTAARIPGVQVYRQGGEASRVLVRGLPDFTTTYNGREIFTAETRVVALQDFPSSNIAALEVFKTSTADLVEPGLAGLVNVRSRRAFDFRDGQIAGAVWGLYTRQADKATPNFNFLATKRWDTSIGEIGILVNGSYTELQYLDSEPSNTDFIADPVINGVRTRFPDVQRLFYRSGNRARPSANVSLQWKPADNFELYFDGLWQGFRNKIDDRILEGFLFGGDYSNLVYRPGTNILSSGTINNAGRAPFSFQGATYNKTNTYQFAVGGKYGSGPLKLSFDAAKTQTTFTGSTISADREFVGRPQIDFDLEGLRFSFPNFDTTNPANYRYLGVFEQNQQARGKDIQVRGDATYEVSDEGLLRSVSIGARYTKRDARRDFGDRFAGTNLPLSGTPLTFELVPAGFRGSDFEPVRFLAPTYESLRENIVQLRQLGGVGPDAPVRNRIFTADESTLAGYGQVAYGFGETIDGLLGLRVVRTKTTVAGPVPTGIPTIDEGTKSTDYLPNASIRWRADPQLQFRLAFSQTRTRPNFSDLVPSITLDAPPPGGVGTDSAPRTGRGGNPFLTPFTSDNYDATIEYYFSPTGFASVALFRRDLQGFILDDVFRFTDPTLGVVQITGRTNAGGGRINGLEAQFNTFFDFDFLPQWARSFGIQANLTYLDAKVEQESPTTTRTNPTTLILDRITGPEVGISKWNYNLVGLYEREGFSARLTYNGRSRFQAQRQVRRNDVGALDDFYLEEAKPADRLDLSLNYDVLPQATVFFDWTNITNTPFRQSFSSARGGADRVGYERYLRYDEATVSLGVRFRFGG